jgi:peptidoglycan hydrolase-like protein with peptidoglycan-binding domain
MPLYQRPGLVLQRAGNAPADIVRALQRDLRALGYLRSGTDGVFGGGTEAAVRALQYDLLHNDGRGSDGDAPVAVRDFNATPAGMAVSAVNGIFDQALADCLVRLLAHDDVPKLPSSMSPTTDNAHVQAAIAACASASVPIPFISAIVRQESGGQHYVVPTASSDDNFIVVGLDRNGAADQVTSRGYGIGQFTLFHHPPRTDEVRDVMLDPVRNVQRAQLELREKFDRFVVGPSDRADDRSAEHPLLPLRVCRYAPSDARHLRDCRHCANSVRKLAISTGTPLFAGASGSYQPTPYYATVHYTEVPDRAEFLCDWPYAVRRYNGGGVNSYHYQTRVLLKLASLPNA